MEFLRKYRKIIFGLLIYLLVGFLISISQYFMANPGYLEPCPAYVAEFKCMGTAQRVIEIISQPIFWINLPIWPWNFVFGRFFAN